MRKPVIYLLHFAGGNCYSFDFLKPYILDFDAVVLELPGRGRRMSEALIKDFDEATLDIFHQILRKRVSARFLVYGHSMGAYLGLSVTSLLEQHGHTPSFLIVSGNPGPGALDASIVPARHLMERARFANELGSLGGTPRELIEDEELFNYLEPILRADFQIAEKNNLADHLPVGCPIHALMGNQEENTESIRNWERFTSVKFSSSILEGDHFFIRRHPKAIADTIRTCYFTVNPEALF